MALRDTLRKAAGLLVELPPEPQEEVDVDELIRQARPTVTTSAPPPTRTVEQLLKESTGPSLEEIHAKSAEAATVAAASAATSIAPAGEVDLATIYQQAGLPPAPFTAEQMLTMLESLPPELPLDTRRQTVRVTLEALGKSVGATPETIVADASRKLAALTSYEEHTSKQTTAFVAEAQQEIGRLQAQIEEKRKQIEQAGQRLKQLTAKCEAESHRLDEVLEFFSLDVPPSKNAPAEKPTNGV